MSGQYPRVVEGTFAGGRDWHEDEHIVPTHKVVPIDAIVIEPLDFGDEQALSIAANALGYAPRTTVEVARLHEHVTYLASALARLHPAVDETQVEALADDMRPLRGTWEEIARRLVEQGWTKPEVQ